MPPSELNMEKQSATVSRFLTSSWTLMASFLPVWTVVFLLFSSMSLLNFLRARDGSEIPVGFGEWSLFYCMSATAPAAAYVAEVLPSGWMSLLGVVVTLSGWTLVYLSSTSQILLFALSTGIGAATIFHASYAPLSYIYHRQSFPVCLTLLFMLGLLMVCVRPLIEFMQSEHQAMLMITCVLVLSYIVQPWIMTTNCVMKASKQMNIPPNSRYSLSEDEELKLSSVGTKLAPATSQENDHHSTILLIGWVFLLIWWALGVDLTWMTDHQPHTGVLICCLQCALSLISFAARFIAVRQIKSGQELDSATGDCSLVLGLIGTAGLTIAMSPSVPDSFHYSLLFSVSFTIQITDLIDLFGNNSSSLLVRTLNFSKSSEPGISEEVTLIDEVARISCQTVKYFLTASVFMLLVNPLAYVVYCLNVSIFTDVTNDKIFLAFLSTVAICLSLLKPGEPKTTQTDKKLIQRMKQTYRGMF